MILISESTSHRSAHAALFLVAGLAASCGGSEESAPASADAVRAEGVHGQAPPAVSGVPSVVELFPETPLETAGDRPTPVIDQLGLMFSPAATIATAGGAVTVTNSESLVHNVHVVERETGRTVVNEDVDPSGRIEVPLASSGPYDVLCETHPGMRAIVYATTAPYAVFAETDGRFQISKVPPGRYRLVVWSVDPDTRKERSVEVTGASTLVDLSER